MQIVGLELIKLNLVTYLFMSVIYFMIPFLMFVIIKVLYGFNGIFIIDSFLQCLQICR